MAEKEVERENVILELVEEMKRGKKIPFKRTKMRVPYKSNGTEDWDNAEIVKVTYE